MAVAFAGSATSVETGGVSSFAIPNHVIGAGSDRCLVVGVGSSAGTPSGTTSVKWNTTETTTEKWDYTAQTFYHNSGHYLVGPTTGTHNIDVVLGATQDECGAWAINLTGVDSGAPVGTDGGTPSGSSTTSTVTVSAATDDLVVANLYGDWTGSTITSGEAERVDIIVAGTTTLACYTEPGAASVTVSTTRTAGSGTKWLINAVAFKAVASATKSRPIFPSSSLRFVRRF